MCMQFHPLLFPSVGVSKGQFFDQYLKFIRLNDVPVEFGDSDVDALIKSNYDPVFHEEVYQKAALVCCNRDATERRSGGPSTAAHPPVPCHALLGLTVHPRWTCRRSSARTSTPTESTA